MHPRLHGMFHLAQTFATRSGASLRVVSANDHGHVRNSRHYSNEALDFWSSDLDGLATWLAAYGYRVLWQVPGHYAHVHAEG
jgi:hypothetical protein